MTKTIQYYSKHAGSLAADYDRLRFEQVHGAWLAYLPQGGAALDVGAGSGRDARALAERGFEVIACEPAHGMLAVGQAKTTHPAVRWMEDQLPELEQLSQSEIRFDLILVSAVWMHLMKKADRERSMRKLADLLKPGGTLVITLRHGPRPSGREMVDVPLDEILQQANRQGLISKHQARGGSDRLNRPGVSWDTLVWTLPGDGTQALPLLRQMIFRERFTATYKPALVRTLLRIADSASGMILERNDREVVLPLGLVGLFWIKQYRRLLDLDLPQISSSTGLSFDKGGFQRLADVSPLDYNIGYRLHGRLAADLWDALERVTQTIANMPAKKITHANTLDPILFAKAIKPKTKDESYLIDRDFLRKFGIIKVPRPIWEAMSQHGCWLEPAVLAEWSNKIQSLLNLKGSQIHLETIQQGLTWMDNEAKRCTDAVRVRAREVRKEHGLVCIWSGQPLPGKFAVDHCFPFQYWPNNYLWNLVPVSPKVNSGKSNKLPSAAQLAAARDRMIQWWHHAYGTETLRERFINEACSALPMLHDNTMKDHKAVFAAVQAQRLRLRDTQGIPEWDL